MKHTFAAITLLLSIAFHAHAGEPFTPTVTPTEKWPGYNQWEQSRFDALPPLVQSIIKLDEANAVKLIEQDPKLIKLTVTKHEVERTANPDVKIAYIGSKPEEGYPLVILATVANLPQVLAAMAKHDPAALLATDPDGEQSLYWAIKAQAYEAAEFLASHGLDPLRSLKKNGHYDFPFSKAMERWDMRMVKILLAHVPRQKLPLLEYELWKVAGISDSAWLRLFLEAGVNPNSRSGYLDESTPLVQAVSHGWLENVKLLIQYGAKDDGKTFGNKNKSLIEIADLSVNENDPDTLEIQRLIHAIAKPVSDKSGTSAVFAEGVDQDKPPLSADELQQYRALSKRIKENYVEPVDDKRLFNGCLSGMGKLDSHSEYYDAEAYQYSTGDSNSAGVGLELGIKNHRATVVSALEDTPASQAGIRPGDSLFKIDGNIVVDLPLDKVVRLLRGKPDTTLRLAVLRDGSPEPLAFDLTRKEIKVQTVKSRLLEPGYGYVQLNAFTHSTIEKFVDAMQALDKQSGGEMKGLVLDLRNNPGGLFDKSLALAGAFLPNNAELVSIKGRAEDMTRSYTNNRNDNNNYLSLRDFRLLKQLPFGVERVALVVLVNNQSAAGTEIVVGALQDYRRALIVGTPTFGKDTLQTLMSLHDGTALKLTTGRWQTPNGRSSAPAGIAPDIFVAATAKDSLQESDSALDRALVSLKRGQAPEPIPGLDEKLIQKVLDNFYTYSPQMLDDLREEAFAANKAHQTDKAIERWSKLLDEKLGDEQAFRARGALYAEQGKRDLAFADLLLAVEQDPNAASTRNAVCWSKILLGDFADAQSDCIKALALDPGNSAATVNLGHTWLLRGDKDKAWSWYEKVLPFIESKEVMADILADFDLFKKRGWQPKLSQAAQDWFAKQGKAWLARRAPADQLIAKIRAAKAAKDTATELKLRIERLNELEKLLPATHPIVIFAANALADTYMQAKQPDQALPLYLRMMNYLDDLDGNPPRWLITTINKITEALNAKEYTGKVTPTLEQVLEVMERHWGPDHKSTQSLVRRLAAEYVEENPARALDLARRALAYQEQQDAPVGKKPDGKKIETTYTIIKALQKLKLHGESIVYLEKLLALLNQDREKNLNSIIDVTESLAGTHGLLDHPDQALTYYKQALEMQRTANNGVPNHEYIIILNKAGGMLSHFNRLDAATPYLEEAVRVAEQLYGKDNFITRQMSKKLDEHRLKLEQRGKPEEGKTP